MKGYSEPPHPEDQLHLITSPHSVLTVDQKTLKAPWENFQSLDTTRPKMPHKHICAQKEKKNSLILLQACKVSEFNTHTHTLLPEPPVWAWRDGSNLSHSQSTTITPHGINAHTHANSPILPLLVLRTSGKPDALTDSIFYHRYRVTMGIPRSEHICTRSSNQTISFSCHSVALILSSYQKNTE